MNEIGTIGELEKTIGMVPQLGFGFCRLASPPLMESDLLQLLSRFRISGRQGEKEGEETRAT